MKTLVTGATGFLGAHLVAELIRHQDPASIRVFSQSRSATLDRLGVEVVSGSVLVPDDLKRAVDGVDRIYHLAGFVSRKPADGHRMFAVHVDGTRLLCAAAKAAAVKDLLLVSTSGTVAVSDRADEFPDEDSRAPVELIGRWAYYASKLYQEETATRACGDSLRLVTVNPSMLLGPGDDRLSSTRDVLNFLAGDIPMIPPGGLNFVDVRDVAAVLPVAMEKGRAGARYLLGGPNWSFREFLGRLSRMTKVAGPRFAAPRGDLSVWAARAQAAVLDMWGRKPRIDPSEIEMARYFWYFHSHRAADELGFIARDATETLHDTVKYVRETFLGKTSGRPSV